MADALDEYVERIVEKKIQDSDCLIVVPAKVTQILTNGMYVVQTISNDAEYCVPNWSGTDLSIGENVHLYYKGKLLSDRTAYIGAAFFQNSIDYVTGSSYTGEIAANADPVTVSTIHFKTTRKQKVFVSFNSNIINYSTGTNIVTTYLGTTAHTYQYKMSFYNDGVSYSQNYMIPFEVDTGEHTIYIKSNGTARIGYYNVYAYVYGQGIKEVVVNG